MVSIGPVMVLVNQRNNILLKVTVMQNYVIEAPLVIRYLRFRGRQNFWLNFDGFLQRDLSLNLLGLSGNQLLLLCG